MKRKWSTRDGGNSEKKILNSERIQDFLLKSISEKEAELECPVCLRVVETGAAIFSCQQQHLLCSDCRPRVRECPQCREKYSQPPLRHRFAEKMAMELNTLREELAAYQDENETKQTLNKSNSKKVAGNLKERKEDSPLNTTEGETNHSAPVVEKKMDEVGDVRKEKETEDLKSLCKVIDEKNQRIITSLLAGGFLRLEVVPAREKIPK